MNRRRAETLAAWVVVTPFALWTLIRLFGLDGGYPLEAMMPFTPYVATASVAAFALALALRRRAPAAMAALAAICLGAAVLPRQFGDDTVSAAGLDSRLRHHVLDAAPSSSGTAIYSSFSLRQMPTAPYRFKMARAEASLPGGRRLRIVAVHPFPPTNSTVTGEWEEVLSTLPSGGRRVPWLLAGDFNATFDQAPFRELVDRGFEPLPNSDHTRSFARLALPGR